MSNREAVFPGDTGTHIVAGGAAATMQTGEGSVTCVILTPTTNISTVTLYDNTSAAGTVLCKLQAAASGQSTIARFNNLKFSTGLHVVTTGTGANAYVYTNG